MKLPIYLEITPFFPTPDHFVGPYIYDQVRAIEKTGKYEVVVVKTVSFFSKEPQIYTYQGIKVYNFKVFDLPSSILPGQFQVINLARFENFLRRVVNIEPEEIRFIHSHVAYPAGAIGVDFGKKHGIRSFVQHHGLDVMQLTNGRLLKGSIRKINELFIKRRFINTVNQADLNIGVSQKVLDELKKIDEFSNENSHVLYNGVDTEKFFRKSRTKNEKFTIGCIGNFWKIKDQMVLLKALDLIVNDDEVDNIHVIFIGSGKYLQSCKDFVHKKRLENYVTFKKEIDHSLLNDFYNRLDLFVLPSYYEALGCVYTEALQVGVPIIAVEGQGIEELISDEDKNHCLIPKGDYTKLAKLILDYMNNKYTMNTYDLNINKFIDSFIDFIEKRFL